ncbi:EF-hand domain-containing protein, partial [archaeon]
MNPYGDINRSNTYAYQTHLYLQGSLNARRQALVAQAFDILDKDGSGEIDLTDIAMCYDASQHPEVRSGKKTMEAVLTEFLEGFDVGGTKDNKVTRQEFENYYAGISASIDSDNYFELMMRNAWHISGGEGDAANSSNLRVLVTRLDGSQTVEEVKNDMGIKKRDTAAIISRLKAQGVPVKSISLLGGVDVGDGKVGGGGGGIGMPSPPRGDMSGRPSTAGGRKRGAG